MEIAHSRNGVAVRLTTERWQHIIRRHPEMRWQRHRELDDADGFVITAYLTRRLNRDREVLWSR